MSAGGEPPEDPRPDDAGLTPEELAAEAATELPARQAMSAIGDIAIPLDPDMAAEVLLAQDEPAEPAEPEPPEPGEAPSS